MTYGGQRDDSRPERIVESMQERARQLREVHEQLADIVGTATSEDGFVTATVGAKGLTDLTFEARAMRMPSEDLARTVVETTQRAAEEFSVRRAEKASELGAAQRPTLEESLAHLSRLGSMVQSSQGDISTVFQRFRDEAGGGR